MRKLWLLSFFLAAVLTASVSTYSNPVYAIEGTCAWHGGINCAAGSDVDGSAICNDGWRDSTEAFWSASICEDKEHSCNSSQLNSLMKKYNIKAMQDEVESLSDEQQKAFDDKYDSTLSEEKRAAASTAFYEVSNELLSLQSDLDFNLSLLKRECLALGEENYRNWQVESLKRVEAYEAKLREEKWAALNQLPAPTAPSLPQNSEVTNAGNVHTEQKIVEDAQGVSSTIPDTDVVATDTPSDETEIKKSFVSWLWSTILSWFQ